LTKYKTLLHAHQNKRTVSSCLFNVVLQAITPRSHSITSHHKMNLLQTGLLLLAMPPMVAAFTSPRHSIKASSHAPHYYVPTFMKSPRPPSTMELGMSSGVAGDVSLVITGNNIDLTPSLQDYVEKRIGTILNKLGSGGIVRECDVHLSVCKNPKVPYT
jgi:hypothetical protein